MYRMPDELKARVIEDQDQADDSISAWASASESEDRSFSPFEFTAKEFNDRDDADECCFTDDAAHDLAAAGAE